METESLAIFFDCKFCKKIVFYSYFYETNFDTK